MSTSNTTSRLPTSRAHSHSVSLGAANSAHRVTRRKSMNASAVNSAAAVAAALQEELPGVSKRRSFTMRNTGNSRGLEHNKNSNSAQDSYPFSGTFKGAENPLADDESAIADDFLSADNPGIGSKTKARRASEGSYLTKGEGKRSSGELRCEKCGKGYKHSSCLTKHLSVFPELLFASCPTLIPLHFACIHRSKQLKYDSACSAVIEYPVDRVYQQVGTYS